MVPLKRELGVEVDYSNAALWVWSGGQRSFVGVLP